VIQNDILVVVGYVVFGGSGGDVEVPGFLLICSNVSITIAKKTKIHFSRILTVRFFFKPSNQVQKLAITK
jgi:hypothetical protein